MKQFLPQEFNVLVIALTANLMDRKPSTSKSVYDVRPLLADHHVIIHYTYVKTQYLQNETFLIKNILE